MKVYKIEVMIIDFDEIGVGGIKDVLENARYSNHCIAPKVKKIEERTIEWSDDHPLNSSRTMNAAYADLFRSE